jgi:hypothetical protein
MILSLIRKVGALPLKNSFGRHVSRTFATGGFPAPRLFDYATVTSNLTVSDAIESVEEAFKALSKGKVDVPMPMHIGIEESDVAGPGDCHIKGGCKLNSMEFLFDVAMIILKFLILIIQLHIL